MPTSGQSFPGRDRLLGCSNPGFLSVVYGIICRRFGGDICHRAESDRSTVRSQQRGSNYLLQRKIQEFGRSNHLPAIPASGILATHSGANLTTDSSTSNNFRHCAHFRSLPPTIGIVVGKKGGRERGIVGRSANNPPPSKQAFCAGFRSRARLTRHRRPDSTLLRMPR